MLAFTISATLMLALASCAKTKGWSHVPVVGLAWSDSQSSFSYKATKMALEETGAQVVVLDQVKSGDLNYTSGQYLFDYYDPNSFLDEDGAAVVKSTTWRNSNVKEVLDGVDCVVFAGGSDISPTLYRNVQPWHGIAKDSNYSVERDVSDYILMSYCLDNDIPVLAICRGMQMLGIVKGADVAQDLGQWFAEQGMKYNDEHRDPDRLVYAAHSVDVVKNSLLYKITGEKSLEKVPSWHHQIILNAEEVGFRVSATCVTDGVPIIEAIELPELSFCLGVQFHPEISVRKTIEESADSHMYMDKDLAMTLFRAIASAGAEHH